MRRHGRERVHVRVAVAAAVSLCGRDGQLSVAGSRLPVLTLKLLAVLRVLLLARLLRVERRGQPGDVRVARLGGVAAGNTLSGKFSFGERRRHGKRVHGVVVIRVTRVAGRN